MINFAAQIEAVAGDEPIESVVVGRMHDYDAWDDEPQDGDLADQGRALTWADARPLLDYDYDNGFGSAGCHPVYAWTATRILYVHEYDGRTSVCALPRNPRDITPHFG